MPRALLLGQIGLRELTSSYVVTGAGGAIGRAVAERLAADGHVLALDLDDAALGWTSAHANVTAVPGDASDGAFCERAAVEAAGVAPLRGWVNNAAVFRDATLHGAEPSQIVALIAANLALAVAGCAAAVRHMERGAIVNVSSHQAQRPVLGALPYATAKAAIEGLTRAAAVDYGPRGIRVNAVALGTIANPIVPVDGGRAALGQDPEARRSTS